MSVQKIHRLLGQPTFKIVWHLCVN